MGDRDEVTHCAGPWMFVPAPGVLEGSDLAITDVAYEIRLVEQLQDKRSVVEAQMPQAQPRRLANDHVSRLSRFIRM